MGEVLLELGKGIVVEYCFWLDYRFGFFVVFFVWFIREFIDIVEYKVYIF